MSLCSSALVARLSGTAVKKDWKEGGKNNHKIQCPKNPWS